MEHLKVSSSSSDLAMLSTTISEAELMALQKIVSAYAKQAKHTGYLTVAETLPPLQIEAIQNKVEQLILMF